MKITNKRAYHEYTIIDKYEAGMNLLGSEVKSVKGGRINLGAAFVRIVGTEAFLINAEIPLYSFSRPDGYDPRRSRKLLLHKREILKIKEKTAQSNLTSVPLACYTKGSLVKLEIGIGKGKREHEKREELRRKDIQREVEQDLRKKL